MPSISRFSPNWSDPEVLEAITVAREHLISDAVEKVRESALTANKHHLLFIGPRGSGKTHLITIIHHRISKMRDLKSPLCIAWLNEDQTCDSLLSLLLQIHQALSKAHPEFFPASSLEPIYNENDRLDATHKLTELLLKQTGDKTLLILIENLDLLFHEFDEAEQKRWRAFIQDYPIFCTVATGQRLFHGVSNSDAPFYGFFDLNHLKPFSATEAAEMLGKIAKENHDTELRSFIQSNRGRGRTRALHHLTGGNQRLFVILSDFINKDSLDDLVKPFEELVDEQLTPYYQERLRWLPTLQRRIVEFLCSSPKPQPVKAIERHLFVKHQTISSQLADLRKMGYVISKKRGRESLYELAEPLMRLSYEVKEAKGRTPLRLLVNFLRVWYDHEELESRMSQVSGKDLISKMYFTEAHAKMKTEGNLRLQYFQDEADGIDLTHCNDEELGLLKDLKDESTLIDDVYNYGLALAHRGNYHDALKEFTTVVECDQTSTDLLSKVLNDRGAANDRMGNWQLAIDDHTAVIELKDAPIKQFARALINRGVTHGQLGNPQLAIDDYSAVIELKDAPIEPVARALVNRGITHGQLGNPQLEIDDYSVVIELKDAPIEQVARALVNRGFTHGQLGNPQLKIDDYSAVIKLKDTPIEPVARALVNRGITHGQLGNPQLAIDDYSAVIELKDAPIEQVARALVNRGITHGQLGNPQLEIDDYSAVIELKDAPIELVARALVNRGFTHGQLGNPQLEIEDYSAVIELKDAPIELVSRALVNRGFTHGQLGNPQLAINDFSSVIESKDAPIEQVAMSLVGRGIAYRDREEIDLAITDFSEATRMKQHPHSSFHLAEIWMRKEEWDKAFKQIAQGFDIRKIVSSRYYGNLPIYLNYIFTAGQSPESWEPKVKELAKVYAKNDAINHLAKGLVTSINFLRDAHLSTEGMVKWHQVWADRAKVYPELELPCRLLRTGIDFLNANEEETALLDLPSEERRILIQALEQKTDGVTS